MSTTREDTISTEATTISRSIAPPIWARGLMAAAVAAAANTIAYLIEITVPPAIAAHEEATGRIPSSSMSRMM